MKGESSIETGIRMRSLGRWTLACGILSILFYVLHDVVGAMHYPGYNHMRQAVSDLTAADAPSFVVASGFSTVYSIYSCICCAFLCVMVEHEQKTLRTGIRLFALMNGISAVGYALFPLSGSGYDGSMQSFVHVYTITALVVILSILSLILTAVGSFRDRKRTLGCISILALACMFLGAVGSAVMPKEIFGVMERFSTYSAVIFTGVLGIYGHCLGD